MLAELALRDQPVAMIASNQRTPSMTGVEFLDEARAHAPDAKLLLLTASAWSGTGGRSAVTRS